MRTLIVRLTWGAVAYLQLPAWLASMTQLPTAVKVTTVPDTVHTPGPLEAPTENTTGLPEPPPVANKFAEDCATPNGGAVKEIDCDIPLTVIVRWTWGAAAYLQIAGLVGVDDAAARCGVGHRRPGHGACPGAVEAPRENMTGLPEPPPVAERCAEPPAVPEAGAVKEIDWGTPLTVIVRWTWGAAAYLRLAAWLAR